MRYRKNKQKIYIIIILFLSLTIGLGYSYLSTSLDINGSTKVSKNTWDVHFENVIIQSDSTIKTIPTINNNKDLVSFTVSLSKPGDAYHFLVDVKNSGTIDAMISVFSNSSLTANQKIYLEYNVSYPDDISISQYDLLKKNESQTIEVFLKYKDDITIEDLLYSQDEDMTLSFNITYVQADSKAKEVPQPFSKASWDNIAYNVKNGSTNHYKVGDTKEVDLGTYGKHLVRIANMSTPVECSNSGFSQTSCGFVVEFTDVVTSHPLGSETSTITYDRAIDPTLNTIYSHMPADLQRNIVSTYTVFDASVVGQVDYMYTKLYLLSSSEIHNSGGHFSDRTRKIDYYINFTVNNADKYIKKYNGYANDWWLRDMMIPRVGYSYAYMSDKGSYELGSSSVGTTANRGVSPTFRIG